MKKEHKNKNNILFIAIVLILLILIGSISYLLIKDINDAKSVNNTTVEEHEEETIKETLTTKINGYNIEIPNRLITNPLDEEDISSTGVKSLYYDNAYKAIYAFNILLNTSIEDIEEVAISNNYEINTNTINDTTYKYITKINDNIKTTIGFQKINDNTALIFYIFNNTYNNLEEGMLLDIINVYKSATKEEYNDEVITKDIIDYLNITPGMNIASTLE